MYHENHKINDVILTIINDGNGETCGMTYQERKAAVKNHDLPAIRRAVEKYGKKYYGENFKQEYIFIAGDFIFDYYEKEMLE